MRRRAVEWRGQELFLEGELEDIFFWVAECQMMRGGGE